MDDWRRVTLQRSDSHRECYPTSGGARVDILGGKDFAFLNQDFFWEESNISLVSPKKIIQVTASCCRPAELAFTAWNADLVQYMVHAEMVQLSRHAAGLHPFQTSPAACFLDFLKMCCKFISVRVSLAMEKHDDQKQLVKEMFYFILQFHITFTIKGSQSGNSRQKPRVKKWNQS